MHPVKSFLKKINKQQVLTTLLVLLFLATLALIWGNSLEKPEQSSQKSQFVMEQIIKPILGPIIGEEHVTEYLVRKMAHFTEFFILGLEGVFLLLVGKRVQLHWVFHTLAAGFLVGAIDETIQIFTGRGSCLTDVWIDFSGFVMGVGVVLAGYGIRHLVKIYK